MQILKTERTTLRPFELSDIPIAFSWLSDPVVMKHIPNGPDPDLAVSEKRIRNYMRIQAERGFSKWIVLDRESGQPIGDSGIMWLEEMNGFELGYRLASPYWGSGLATEIARAWLRAAPNLGLREVFAFAHVENLVSQNVLTKLGFVRERHAIVTGMNSIVYRMEF